MPRHPGVAGRLSRPHAEESARSRDVRVAAIAGQQWRIVSVADLHECGLSADAIATRVGRGALHPMHRGVYAVGHANPPLEGVFLAAVKACGQGAVLSHFAAAAAWGMLEWDERLPEVTVLRSRTPAHPKLRAHRTARLEPCDVTSWKGIPITSPARTLIDIASRLGHRHLRRAVRQAQSLRLVTLGEITDALRRHPGRRGTRKLARVVATGPAPTRSVLEDVVLDLIVAAGIELPAVNVPLRLGGRTIVPDFRWPRERLIVEADGAAWHDHQLAREDDAERQAVLEAHGERVLRVTWAQAVAKPTETIARFRAAGAPAGA